MNIEELRAKWPTMEEISTGGGFVAYGIDIADKTYIVTADDDTTVPADDAVEAAFGVYCDDDELVDAIVTTLDGNWMTVDQIDALLTLIRRERVTTVGAYFAGRLGRKLIDPHQPLVAGETDIDTLSCCPLDSAVGSDCKRAIDAAATLLGFREGGFDRIREDVEQLCLVFMYG